MPTESESLLKAAGKGNIEAYEILTGSYMKIVYNMMLTSSGKSDYASQLSQEVFVRVFKNIKAVKSINLLGFIIYKTAGDVSRNFSVLARKISKKSYSIGEI